MVDRIKKVMAHYGFSSTQFADKIGAQRSAMSHVLSGRNKPSLDFTSKIKRSFPEISLDWLVLGAGNMLQNAGNTRDGTQSNLKPLELSFDTPKPLTASSTPDVQANDSTTKEEVNMESLNKEDLLETIDKTSQTVSSRSSDKPELIVFYYSDGTFKNYRPR